MAKRIRKQYTRDTGVDVATLIVPVSNESGLLVELWVTWDFVGTSFQFRVYANTLASDGTSMHRRPLPHHILSNSGGSSNTIDSVTDGFNSISKIGPGLASTGTHHAFACDSVEIDVTAFVGTSIDFVTTAVYEY